MSERHKGAGVSRREFLKESGLAVAAGSVASGLSAAPSAGTGNTDATASAPPALQRAGNALAPAVLPGAAVKGPVRLAVVGGNFGAQFYWHEHPDCRVVAVSDLQPGRLAYMKTTYGCATGYASLDELLADDQLQCDAVAIFTDATDLVDHCIACLAKGKHVISASPAALNIADARRLRSAVAKSGLTYVLAETSYFQQSVISARQWFKEGKFGTLFSCEAEYHHPGLEKLFVDEQGRRTWRYGLPPMLYSTHCTGQLMGVSGEHLVSVTCQGWGDGDPILKDNPFNNPFWCETALFQTSRGNSFRAAVYWRGALGIAERATWMGSDMSFYAPTANGSKPIIRRTEAVSAKSAEQSARRLPVYEKYDQQLWWETDLLPPPLRHISGHDGSHTFLTHTSIMALLKGERPPMDIDFALDLALPGIIAHESALAGGQRMAIPRSASL